MAPPAMQLNDSALITHVSNLKRDPGKAKAGPLKTNKSARLYSLYFLSRRWAKLAKLVNRERTMA